MGKIWNDRLALHDYLLEVSEITNVYFQPPESIKLNYPAIIYSLNNIANIPADNITYVQNVSYTITVVDRMPDSELAEKVSLIPHIMFDRSYTADNLNHFVFTLFV